LFENLYDQVKAKIEEQKQPKAEPVKKSKKKRYALTATVINSV